MSASSMSSTSSSVATQSATVEYTESGFSPSRVIIPIGGTVTFVNHSTQDMRVASNPHPTHTDYQGFDEGTSVGNGQSYSFTFTKAGTWGYHNHLSPNRGGQVVVQ